MKRKVGEVHMKPYGHPPFRRNQMFLNVMFALQMWQLYDIEKMAAMMRS